MTWSHSLCDLSGRSYLKQAPVDFRGALTVLPVKNVEYMVSDGSVCGFVTRNNMIHAYDQADNKLWSVRLPKGFGIVSSPWALKGKILIASHETLLCYDLSSGELLWSAMDESESNEDIFYAQFCELYYSDDEVAKFRTYYGGIRSVRLIDGQISVVENEFGLIAYVMGVRDKFIIAGWNEDYTGKESPCGDFNKGMILNTVSREAVWSDLAGDSSYYMKTDKPLPCFIIDDRVYVSYNRFLQCYSVNDGSLIWKTEDCHLFICTDDVSIYTEKSKNFTAISLETGAVLWEVEGVVWKEAASSRCPSSPRSMVNDDAYVYFTTDLENELVIVDKKKRQLHMSLILGEVGETIVTSRMMLNNGRVYVPTNKGVYVYD